MNKNLVWKITLIIILALLAALRLYPPNKTLKPGIDLAGGTSLLYEIDTHGLSESDKQGLSESMITILRRRIDPANIQNLIWRPQGNTRFEIQMPLASAEARQERQNYEVALTQLLEENINPATILRSLPKSVEQRAKDFEGFASGSEQKQEILNKLAEAYDNRKNRRAEIDNLALELEKAEVTFESAQVDVEQIELRRHDWIKLNGQQLTDSLKEFLGSELESKVDLLTSYLQTYSQWAKATDQLLDPEFGEKALFKSAQRRLDEFNLSEDQIKSVLTISGDNRKAQAIKDLQDRFPRRKELIVTVADTFDKYKPFQGRLDDPRDLQRMLKGAGILEFRILPTVGHPEIDNDEMANYVELLKIKGPKYASDKKYVWCELETKDPNQWHARDDQGRPTIIAGFGNKSYVLASNLTNEAMLHTNKEKDWKLKKAAPGTEGGTGRRSIDFLLDPRAGKIFRTLTGENIGRPLCILLDGMAISAPNINSVISTRGQITGTFNKEETADMVNKLNAGSLPARLIEQPISIRTIGPSIGADNRDLGIKAGLAGLAAVIICMAVYYTLAGSIADLALVMNLLLVLAIMALARATFTLPGIAGLILTIGMSVDANVLIFERIREEQGRGSSLAIAIKNGYQRAFRTILDANLTTFITAAILYRLASEEIKGFAIVLMLGIVASMFTSLFVTRTIFEVLLSKRIIKDHLVMLRLIHRPNINWMNARGTFFIISTLLVVGGLFVFYTRDDQINNKYDIEFTGGTSVQINLKEGVALTRQEVEDRFRKVANESGNRALAAANVYSIGKSNRQYEINTTETNRTVASLTFAGTNTQSPETIDLALRDKLSNLTVAQLPDTAGAFTVTTSQINKSIVSDVLETAFPDANISEVHVDEVVNNAVLAAFADVLAIQRNLQPKITGEEKIDEETVDLYPELVDFLGGVRISCQIERQATTEEIDRRIKDLRFKPDMRDVNWYSYKILGSDLTAIDPNQAVTSFVYISVEPEAGLRELTNDEWTQFVTDEKRKVLAATERETSLPRVTQISPSIGSQAKTQALIAIVLSLFAIVAYIWVRFGNVRYGLAAIIALVHDVCITLGAVTACTYLAGTTIGQALLIGDFKINLAVIAAFLTLIGYSLNDTIVIFDRIRENRHKDQLSPSIINDSINQTISRTILTSFTTFLVVLIMYIFGGPNLRGFTFAIGLGVIVGTYSSIAIAAPVLLLGIKNQKKTK